MLKKIFIFALAFSLSVVVNAQAPETKEEIQKKQQELQNELDDLNNTLNQIKKNKKQSIGQLALVQKKIKVREAMVENLSHDLKRLDNDIASTSLEINQLKLQLDTLRVNYSKSIVFAYKNRSNYDYLNFLFSATSFNDAVRRIAYLKSYRQSREIQSINIVRTEQLREQKISTLTLSKTNKNQVLGEQSKQLLVLQDDKKQKDLFVQQLKSHEDEIAAQIRTNEKNRVKLKSTLQTIIRREMEEAKRKEQEQLRKEAEAATERKKKEQLANEEAERKRRAATNQPTTAENKAEKAPTARLREPATGNQPMAAKSNRTYTPLESTPEGLTQSLNFESNHGNLPWPVNSGVVTIHFGTYQIPGTPLRNISDGICIALPVGATVKAVADGVVAGVVDLGGQQAVLVRHGKYFTTYSNLSTTNVNKGDELKAGKVIGTAAADDSGEGQLLFMVSNDKGINLDPEKWLRHR
jgi:septal ring factor EnvC (AmiA/AmiB activator)